MQVPHDHIANTRRQQLPQVPPKLPLHLTLRFPATAPDAPKARFR